MNVRVGRRWKENYTKLQLWLPPPEGAVNPLEVDREESQHLQLQPRLENISSGFTEGLTHSLYCWFSFFCSFLVWWKMFCLSVLTGTFSDRCVPFGENCVRRAPGTPWNDDQWFACSVVLLSLSLPPSLSVCLCVFLLPSSCLNDRLVLLCVCCGETPV